MSSRRDFLRRLQSFHTCSKLLWMFYHSGVSGVLIYTVVFCMRATKTLQKLLGIRDETNRPLLTIISSHKSRCSERLLLPKCRWDKCPSCYQPVQHLTHVEEVAGLLQFSSLYSFFFCLFLHIFPFLLRFITFYLCVAIASSITLSYHWGSLPKGPKIWFMTFTNKLIKQNKINAHQV